MSLKFRCIAVLALLILDCYVLSLSTRLNIERGDQDIFVNPKCDSSAEGTCNCNGLNAFCVNSTCKRCKCSKDRTTFISSNTHNGRCVKDRRLLFIPTSTNSFLVEQNNMCMGSGKTYVKGKACNVSDSRQHWIWTRNNQLMHVDSLKCLQLGHQYKTFDYWYIILEECNSAEVRQLWKCHGKKGQTFSSTETSIRSQEKMLFLYNGRDVWGTTYLFSTGTKWKRSGSSDETLCSKGIHRLVHLHTPIAVPKKCQTNLEPSVRKLQLDVAYGCNGFIDSAILLTETKNCTQQCLVEKEIDVPHKSGENSCFVMWEELQYLDKDEWKQLRFKDKIFTIEKRNTKTFLQLDYAKATRIWSGLIVKLHYHCAARNLMQVNTSELKCVVIKFKGTDPFHVLPVTSPTISTTSPGNMSHTTVIREISQRGSSNLIPVIVACVVVAILTLCGILGFIFYKRRRRTESKTRLDNAELPRNILADPVVNFRNSATSPDLDYVIPASAGNIKSSEESSTLIVLPGHGKRAPNRDIKDKKVLDDSGYAIPSETNTASQNVPSTSTALPGQEKSGVDSDVKDGVIVDGHGYVITDMGNTESLEDESGYAIPGAKKMKPQRLQRVPSNGVLDQQNALEERLSEVKEAGDSIKDGGYKPLGERYDHVYQRLLANKNL